MFEEDAAINFAICHLRPLFINGIIHDGSGRFNYQDDEMKFEHLISVFEKYSLSDIQKLLPQ